MYAIKNFLGKPDGIPDERMLIDPIWSTWAQFKTQIQTLNISRGNNEVSRSYRLLLRCRLVAGGLELHEEVPCAEQCSEDEQLLLRNDLAHFERELG